MQSAEHSHDEQQRVALGKAIVIRRTELGLRRRDLQERTGLSYPFVAELEQGTKRMSQRSLDVMANALELRPAELLAMADALTEPPTVEAPAAEAAAAEPRAVGAPAADAVSAEPSSPAPITGGAAVSPPPPPAAAPVFDRLAAAPKRAAASPASAAMVHRTTSPSRWFGARRAAQETRARVDELKTMRLDHDADASAEAAAGPAAEAEASPPTLDDAVQAQVRQMVRDELRKAGIRVTDDD